jgi:hypothetical protein
MKVEFEQKKVEQRCNNVKWKTIDVESQVMQIEKNAKLEGQNGTLGSNKMEVEAPNKT